MATRRGTNGKDRLIGTSAADRIFGLNGNDILSGGRGNDQISGGGGNDTLNGDAGNDTLDGGTGIDTMAGGAGDDTFVVDNALDRATDTAGLDTVLASVSYTLGSGIEVLTLTGTGDLDGTGNALANTLNGTSGDNVLDGGTGADSLNGGAGDDTYIVDNAGDTITDTSGTDTVVASISHTLGSDLENLSLVGTANTDGTGNAGVNTIEGNSGDNVLDGQGGADTMIGGTGNDTFIVDDAGDTVGDLSGIDTVRASVTFTLGSTIEHLILTGSGDINGTGNALANTLTGNDGDNTLNGMGGADTMAGGVGDDIYIVNLSTDVVIEALGEGTDEVRASGPFYQLALGSEIEKLTYTGIGSFTGIGNEFNNLITGGIGTDTLLGGAGDDTLTGGGSRDGLDGGFGNDTYLFNDFDLDSGGVVADSGLGGYDQLKLSSTATSIDFRFANSITGIEILSFTGGQSAYLGAGQLGAGLISTSLIVDGGSGNNILRVLDASSFDGTGWNISNWAGGTIEISGTAGADTITGTNQADNLDGQAGADALDGGEGDDQYTFQFGDLTAGETIADSGSSTGDTIAAFGAAMDFTTATVSGIEKLHVSGASVTFNASQLPNNLAISTGGGTNTVTLKNANGFNGSGFTFAGWSNGVDTLLLEGAAGADSIVGTSVTDTFISTTGADTLDGGAGGDRYEFNGVVGAGLSISDSGATGTDVIRITGGLNDFGAAGASFSGIEGLTFTGGGQEARFASGMLPSTLLVTGAAGQQTLRIDSGASFTGTGWTFASWTAGTDEVRLVGDAGANVIAGTSANDLIIGNGGADTLNGGVGDDTYLFGDVGPEIVAAATSINDTGGSSGDTIEMRHTTDFLLNATSISIAGIDKLRLHDGVQAIFGDGLLTGAIHVTGTAGGAMERVQALNQSSFNGSAFTFSDWDSTNAVWIFGTSAANVLKGTSRGDYILGDSGGDTITGGAGGDALEGGSGTDTFVFAAGDGGLGSADSDVILDFAQGSDLIDLSSFGATFIGNAAFSGSSAPEVRYRDDGLDTFLEIDSNGDGAADEEIVLFNIVIAVNPGDLIL